MIAYQSLVLLSCYLYSRTLAGGDVEFLKDQIGLFVVFMISSIAITLCVGVAIYYTFHLRLRLLNWLIQLTLVVITLTRDLGTDLERHGQFNLIIYFLLWIPLALGISCFFLGRLIKRSLNNNRL